MEISSKEIKERIKELVKRDEINTKDELKLFLVERARLAGYEEGKKQAQIRYVETVSPDDFDITVYDWKLNDLKKELDEVNAENTRLRDLLSANVRVIKEEIKKEMQNA